MKERRKKKKVPKTWKSNMYIAQLYIFFTLNNYIADIHSDNYSTHEVWYRYCRVKIT